MLFFFDIENLDKQDENYDQLMLLNSLIERFEHELVEFKEADNDYDKNKTESMFQQLATKRT